MLRHYENKMVQGHGNKSDGTFVLVASGPSLTSEQVEYCRNKAKILVINDNYRICPWADYHYACDHHWWVWWENDPALLNFKGQKFTQHSSWDAADLERIKAKHRLEVIESKAGKGLSFDKNIIHQGSHSGYQAINLAFHLGATRIILLGYDMQYTGDKFHWFGSHPSQLKSDWSKWVKFYDDIAAQLPEIDLEVINCTTETALTCFPRMNLMEVL